MSNRAKANASGIEPTEYKILVRPIEEDGAITFKSGFRLLKPDETAEQDRHAAMEGSLVALSPFAFSYVEDWKQARKPQVGDRVIFARYSGINVKGNDGRDYRLMNDKDLVAVRGS